MHWASVGGMVLVLYISSLRVGLSMYVDLREVDCARRLLKVVLSIIVSLVFVLR